MSEPLFHMIAGAPTPVAPFSHAVEVDGWVFLTGQMPTLPGDDSAPLPEGIEAQTRRVMDNLIIVLRGLGLGLQHVVSVRAYLTRFEQDYAPMNAVYRSYFPHRSSAGPYLRRRYRPGARGAGGDRSGGTAVIDGGHNGGMRFAFPPYGGVVRGGIARDGCRAEKRSAFRRTITVLSRCPLRHTINPVSA